jgi:FAD:protein FMN transferase
MRTPTATSVEARFDAMGTSVHIVVAGGHGARLLEVGRSRVDELERRWSRFRPDSEVSALNRNAGHPVLVSSDTYELVVKAVAAWRATEGRFDPTVGDALVAHGYDRDFGAIRAMTATVGPLHPVPTACGIELDPALVAVTLPDGVMFDPGGIGKGFAADLTAARLIDAGARGVLVNIGGDLRAVGQAPSDDGWVITVPDPARPRHEMLRLAIPEGAVATSSSLRRRWQTTTGTAHHLIDPATGRPAESDVSSVTVVAGEAWWAEVLTKSIFLSGIRGLDTLDGAHAVVVMADGTRHATDGIRGALR